MSSTNPTSSTSHSLQPPPRDLIAPNLEEMQKQLQAHADANGYKIVIRSSEKKNLETVSVRYECHRSGKKPSVTSRSRKTDCPFAFSAYQVAAPNVPSELQQIVHNPSLPPVGSWVIHIKNPNHNHEPIGSEV
jgi:hypothetical protein